MLPVRLPQDQISELFEWVGANSGAQLTVDLESQTLSGDSREYPFEVDPFRRNCLLKGLNDIDLTLKYEEQIREYESKFA
jgi:3-isopropylmalate/(R)-2-methylmalate dehydratase small subunit